MASVPVSPQCASWALRPAAASSGAAQLVGAHNMDELLEFRRWSVFLPCAASAEVERNAVYVRGRHTGNPRFFEQSRERLALILHDRDFMRTVETEEEYGEATIRALEAVLQAQWTALGFVSNRQFHKALTLGDVSLSIVDALAHAASVAHSGSLLFWQLLVRANLGGAYARFGKHDEATSVLRHGLELTESGVMISQRERVLQGVIYSHLARVCLEAGDVEESSRTAELEIEIFERCIWDMSDTKEDRQLQALVLATSYVNRGICDVRQRRYDIGLIWFGRAENCVEKHADLGPECPQLLTHIREHIDHCKSLQL
eukprot:TRINITY_DN40534_c0_g1_i1.p1 TRINITY_DN40534_c0_g1~~TRINITY_DN40534_c0_g1_i1.p1  ORF type:complete len:316 (+),score=49.63 TRINITY_DN40534_c0_g1_i1:92-1039(+)